MAGQNSMHVESGSQGATLPQRVALLHRQLPARLEAPEEKLVMTFPHLIVREVIAMEILLIVLGLVSLFYDAPLESLANPNKTPNPAKAPWYFLGLQELLHYFPPVVAGVLIPALVVIALIIIPYFRVNFERDSLWSQRRPARLYGLSGGVLLLILFLAWFRVWAALAPTALIGLLMISIFPSRERGLWGFLIHRTAWARFFTGVHAGLAGLSLAAWIMSWFITLAVILTVVGTLFRGPGWSFVWPWQL
ncbi:MAG: hypothetical protein HY858_03030 [Candidatus Solibacter usitatus]|nr:hypothetical protein [Candidatus Solibacter usitatus]